MRNRIDQKFIELKRKKKKAFIAFITAGDPSLKTTNDLVVAFENSGVDIVELGVPFSDPLADGLTIQASSQRSLKKGTNLKKILNTVRNIRRKSQIPIVLMTYYNPVFCFGIERFITEAKNAGVDGLIIPDLPPEEGALLIKKAKEKNIATVFFLSPTTTEKRMKYIVKVSTGFIYYVSLAGVTGARRQLPKSLKSGIRLAKRTTKKPICVGFGISRRSQVESILRLADGVIVGSAIVNQIFKNKERRDLVNTVSKFVSKLAKE